MAKSNKISMPSGTGGLVRYFDDYKSKISLQPMHVIIFIVIVAFIIVLLHIFGVGLLGF
jgi:preprotein translocase subunit Sec61beta